MAKAAQASAFHEETTNGLQEKQLLDLYRRMVMLRAEMIADRVSLALKCSAIVRSANRDDAVYFYMREFETQQRQQREDRPGDAEIDLGKAADDALRARWSPPP